MTEYYERASGAPVPIQPQEPAPIVAHVEAAAPTFEITMAVPLADTTGTRVRLTYDAAQDVPTPEAIAAALHAVARQLLEDADRNRAAARDGILSNSLPEGYVWMGDLAGWEVAPDPEDYRLRLHHRCGFSGRIPEDGITADGSAYIGNILVRALALAEGHVCQCHEPSEEHKARVASWTAQQDSARALPDGKGGIPPMGGMH